MTNFVVLDNVAHANLRVNVEYGEDFGDSVNQALVFPTEFQALQREYPIFFRQTEQQEWYAVVLLGLDKDENLFLEGNHWNARYVPAAHQRGPFALAVHAAAPDAPEQADAVVQIDLDDGRVGGQAGDSVFLPHGGHSPYLEQTLKALQRLHVGAGVSGEFFAQLHRFGLLDEITVTANFGETIQYTVPDLFTISKNRMAQLTGDQLQELNALGLLEHCFAVMSSADNVSRLVDMKALKSGQFG